MTNVPPLRPRFIIGMGAGGPVSITPEFVRWLELVARQIDTDTASEGPAAFSAYTNGDADRASTTYTTDFSDFASTEYT